MTCLPDTWGPSLDYLQQPADTYTMLPQARKERPVRDYLHSGTNRLLDTVAHQPQVQQGQASQEARSYRLDIELGKLEFASHPLMSREDQLVRSLL